MRRAEEALAAYAVSLASRPPPKTGRKATADELATWAAEDAAFPARLAEYREALDEARPSPSCGQPWDGGCNHRWGETHVCLRSHKHQPPHPEPGVTKPPSETHVCRCGRDLTPPPAAVVREYERPAGPPTMRPAQQVPVIPCPNVLPDGSRCGAVAHMGTDSAGRRLPSGRRRCWACDHVWAPAQRNGRTPAATAR